MTAFTKLLGAVAMLTIAQLFTELIVDLILDGLMIAMFAWWARRQKAAKK